MFSVGRLSYVSRLGTEHAKYALRSGNHLPSITRCSGKPLNFAKVGHFVRRTTSDVSTIDNVPSNRWMAYWLLGCASLVGSTIVVGGATRLTRSGLSMVDWKPQGSLPPLSHEEWEDEFQKYKEFPEFQQRGSMTLSEFKYIYAWEYGHRMLGRVIGAVYGLPLAYFYVRNRIPIELKNRFAFLLGLGATQGLIGWWMVRSGLEDHGRNQLEHRQEVRVSPYRLATHLTLAFTTFSMLTWTGLTLLQPPSHFAHVREMLTPDVFKQTIRIRKYFHRAATLFGFTILSGAFVAGTDAGMAYNTFPKMNDEWIPEEIFDLRPLYKNVFENIALVQLDHRILALSSLGAYSFVYALARRPQIWRQLPSQARGALNLSMGVVMSQVLLGITTLLNCVPIPLGIAHQTGAIVLMSSSLWTLHSLNFARSVTQWSTRVNKLRLGSKIL